MDSTLVQILNELIRQSQEIARLTQLVADLQKQLEEQHEPR